MLGSKEILCPSNKVACFTSQRPYGNAIDAIKLLDVIYKNMDAGRLTGVVFLDLKKAFDTVDHDILLKKLLSMNVHQDSILWFSNYLSDNSKRRK